MSNLPHSGDDALAALLTAIVQSSDDAIVSKTLDGIITSWNPAAQKLFGYTPEETIGQPIMLIIPADLHEQENEILARIRRGEVVERLHTERVTKGGERVTVSLSVSPVRTRDGRIIGASKIARDITDRRQADETRARLAAIVDSSSDAVISKRLDGTIESWNRGAEALFGYSAAEAVGRHIFLIVPEDRRDEELQVLERIRRGEQVSHFETERVTRDGRRLAISLTVSPVRNSEGRIIGASKIGRDITERQRVAAERARLLELEQAAREEAEALNRGKDEFLAVLSHEMRTPLNAIYGWARMLHEGQLDPAMRARGTEAILRNATAQRQLIEDLLDVSRIITGNMRLEVTVVDLKAVVETALDSVRPAAAAKEIDLDVTFDVHAGMIVGAPDRLQQVVWNLLMNAVKFTPRGGRVRTEVRRTPSSVQIIVSDTGEGIAADLLPYIFDRFRQGDSSTTRAHGGLGIGLALVRHLVDLHGGTVCAESPGPRMGATFTVDLPTALAVAAEHAATAPRAIASLSGVAVLLVDDDADGLELARVILANAGADVRACRSAAEARDALAARPADVLLLDIEMPFEDGYTLLETIRAAEAATGHATPAIAVTAYDRGEDRTRALAVGFNVYLTKPVDPPTLTEAVATLTRRA